MEKGALRKYRIKTDVYGIKGDNFPVSQKTADYAYHAQAMDGRNSDVIDRLQSRK